MLKRTGVILVAAAAAATVAAAAPQGAGGPSLRRYLSSMSWPLRASAFRVTSTAGRIDGWIEHGDPPFLGGIAANCRVLLEVEARGKLLQVDPPQQLESSHGRLMRAYSAARADCRQTRLEALAARAALYRAFRTKGGADREASDRVWLKPSPPGVRRRSAKPGLTARRVSG